MRARPRRGTLRWCASTKLAFLRMHGYGIMRSNFNENVSGIASSQIQRGQQRFARQCC